MINDIISRRGKPSVGFNPVRFFELTGGSVVETTSFEPDPRTYRHDYYYNANDNRLYRKIVSRYEPENGIIVAHWQGVSQ